MEAVRNKFKYEADGSPDVYSFGVFKDGLTTEEVKDYLRVKKGTWNVESLYKKYFQESRGDTSMFVQVNGAFVNLIYRWDVERHTQAILTGTKTYFD